MHWFIAALSFIMIFFFSLPFPLIVLGAGVFGFFLGGSGAVLKAGDGARRQPVSQLVQTVLVWLAIWILPLYFVSIFFPNSLLTEVGLFFSKLAVVTFGGAYAVLAYMGQAVVHQFGWLTTGEMMDGLGLAETTPGPLILVTEFVGFIAGFREGGIGLGVFAALIAIWSTFAPCFLWIFAGAPYINWIGNQPKLRDGLRFITAAVVGVILNLSIWFSMHVLFKQVEFEQQGILTLWKPVLGSFEPIVFVLTCLSLVTLFICRWSVFSVLLVSSAAAIAVRYILL